MRRAVARTTLALLASAIAVASASQKTDSARAGDGEVVSMRGCVSGSLLKSVRADPGTAAGSFATGDRYRMIGSKAIKAEIKKANKALVEVTGRVKPGPQAVVKGKKMGGTIGRHRRRAGQLVDGSADAVHADHRGGRDRDYRQGL